MAKSPRETGGPVVRTGPTRGKNRSRTQKGRWRARRSDAGKSRSKSGKSSGKKGCFLTTAACAMRGLPDDCHELQVLRRFRDVHLLATAEGTRLVEEYYDIAPQLVPLLDDPTVASRTWAGIRETIDHIEAGAFQRAIETYRKIVVDLEGLDAT